MGGVPDTCSAQEEFQEGQLTLASICSQTFLQGFLPSPLNSPISCGAFGVTHMSLSQELTFGAHLTLISHFLKHFGCSSEEPPFLLSAHKHLVALNLLVWLWSGLQRKQITQMINKTDFSRAAEIFLGLGVSPWKHLEDV